MSVHFMWDNHLFTRLDTKPLPEAITDLKQCIEVNGSVFVGCKGEHGSEVFQTSNDSSESVQEAIDFLTSVHQAEGIE